MPAPKQHFALRGSERAPLEGAREIGPADPNELVDVTIRLRSKAGKKPIVDPEEYKKPIRERKIFSRKEFEQRHGADAESMSKVELFAREHKLLVKEKSAARRTIVLSGTVAAMNNTFGVELKEYEHPGGKYRGRTGPVQLPAELQEDVEGVFGLDNRPQAKPHFRRRQGRGEVRAAAVNLSYTPVQVAGFYEFPTNVDGTGECIALIELGGGYTAADLNAYWSQLGLTKTPAVSAVSVGGGSNQPTGNANGPDGEVMLDIEVAGAIANGAKIVAYFADNTDAGFLNAITTAAHDTPNNPSIISISWGGPESTWTQQAMTSMDEAFQAAAAMGVTVTVAAGDDGSTTGYVTRVDGRPDVIGGTSAVAPLWAGFVALMNQSVGKPVGFINALLYQAGDLSGDFHDITSGSNGAYSARPGRDAFTGLGSPVGSKIAGIFSAGT